MTGVAAVGRCNEAKVLSGYDGFIVQTYTRRHDDVDVGERGSFERTLKRNGCFACNRVAATR